MRFELIKIDGATRVTVPGAIADVQRAMKTEENQHVARRAKRFPPIDALVEDCLRSPMMAVAS